jgi:hypothetical protein
MKSTFTTPYQAVPPISALLNPTQSLSWNEVAVKSRGCVVAGCELVRESHMLLFSLHRHLRCELPEHKFIPGCIHLRLYCLPHTFLQLSVVLRSRF